MSKVVATPLPQASSAASNVTSTGTVAIDHVQCYIRLLSIGQVLCGQIQDVVDHLCQEVASVTQGCAELTFQHHSSLNRTEVLSSATAFRFPIQFRNQVYGTLWIAADPVQPTSPVLPRMIASLLAQICGFILYTWEVSALLHQQLPPISYDIQKTLTRREREILTLMCHGYDQQAIATKLSIATKTVAKHREHIYECLGIHRESDVLLAAYLAGLYSPLEETTN